MNTTATQPPAPGRRQNTRLVWLLPLALLVLIPLLVLLIYAEENWRGKRAWESCKREFAAKGEVLDWDAYIPPPVPNDQNIFNSPRMAEWFVGRGDTALSIRMAPINFQDFCRHGHTNSDSLVVAEITVSTNLDTEQFDAVICYSPPGRFRITQPKPSVETALPFSDSASHSNFVPSFDMEEVPLTALVECLAKEAHLNYSLDPSTGWDAQNTRTPRPTPTVSAIWVNVTVEQVLADVLDRYDLKWIDDPTTGVSRVTLRHPASPQTHDFPGAQERLRDLIHNALGTSAEAPQLFTLLASSTNQINPARILLNCPYPQRPTEAELRAFLRSNTNPASPIYRAQLQTEPMSTNSFRLVLVHPAVYLASDYLAWSDRFAPDFETIRDALKRPFARMDGDYRWFEQIPVANFVGIRAVVQTLAQRAQSHLLLSLPEEALAELTLIHDMCRLVEAKPTGKPIPVVAAIIESAVTALYADVVRDGLRLNAWREPQLAAIQSQLKEINLPALLAESLRSERAAQCRSIELSLEARPARGWQVRLFPRGWIYQNLVTAATLEQEAIEAFDLTNQVVQTRPLNAWEQRLNDMREHFRPYSYVVGLALPNYMRGFQTVALDQTLVDQALIACALERYRLENGHLPESLDSLRPHFLDTLPHDLINGQPMKYRPTGGGHFLLYSVGWNETDEGGWIPFSEEGRSALSNGDWTWRDAN